MYSTLKICYIVLVYFSFTNYAIISQPLLHSDNVTSTYNSKSTVDSLKPQTLDSSNNSLQNELSENKNDSKSVNCLLNNPVSNLNLVKCITDDKTDNTSDSSKATATNMFPTLSTPVQNIIKQENHQNIGTSSGASPLNTIKLKASINKDQNQISSNGSNPEVVDMTNNKTYTGGNEVDEREKGSHKEFKSKEQEFVEHKKNLKENVQNVTQETKSENSTVLPNSKKISSVMETTTAAAIAAGLCVILAVGAYMGILLHKRILLRKYGNREVLINEEDFTEPSDENLRVFEAARIQIQE